MALTQEQRASVVGYITANSPCWQQQGDAQVLNSFSDEKLLMLRENVGQSLQAAAVANAAAGGFRIGNREYRINPETAQLESRLARNDLPPEAKASGGIEGTAKAGSRSVPHSDTTDEEEPDADDMDQKNKNRMMGATYPNNRRMQSLEDVEKILPPSVQNELREMRQLQVQKKDEIARRLIGNVSPADQKHYYEQLMSKSLDDLKLMDAVTPRQPSAEEMAQTANAARGKHAARQVSYDDGVLNLPNAPWEADVAQTTNQESVSNIDFDGLSEGELMQKLPAHIRATYNAASAIVEKERRTLIEEITANIRDEDQLRQMNAMLANKSPEELRAIRGLIGQPEQNRTIFFGGGPTLNTPRSSLGGPDEDQLPLPDWNWDQK